MEQRARVIECVIEHERMRRCFDTMKNAVRRSY